MSTTRFFVPFLLLSLGGCFVFNDVEQPGEQEPPTLTKTVPDRPPADTSSPDDDVKAYFAGYDVEMIQRGDRWREVGLNLDGVNTQAPDYVRPCEPYVNGANPATDGEGGLDNQYGRGVSPYLAVPLPTAICEMTGSHYHGIGTYVAGLENWNGTPNDAQVTVWITPAVGAVPTPDGVEPDPERISWGGERGFDIQVDGEPALPPCYDGNDYFYLNTDDTVMLPPVGDEPRRPRVYDANAYVADNVVVARIPASHPMVLMSLYRSLPARLTDGYIVAKLSDDHERIEEAVLAGRFLAEAILDVTGEIGVCDTSLVQAFRGTLLGAADLMSDPSRDFQGETCDAISVGIPFKAVRANVASVHGPAWTPDDHCELVEEWTANGEGVRRIFGCLSSASKYSFFDQWDPEKNPGLMDHCQNGTLIPEPPAAN